MTNANRHDIQVLNGLIRSTIDSADGYRTAADETAETGYRELFERCDVERREVAEDLSFSVRGLGGEPDAEGSLLAKAQRAFLDVKHALLRDELSLVDAVESTEDHVRAHFAKALEDSHISATTRETIRRAWERLSGDHDAINELKRSLEGQHDADNRLFPQ